MGDAAKKRATYDDVLAAPEHMVAEIIDGELSLMPRPASPHARASSRLGVVLGGPFDRGPDDGDGPGGWILLDEPELHFDDGDVLVPDLAGWRRERMPALPDVAFFSADQTPDWACEVLSPRTAASDRVRKMAIYARERVTHAWLIDPVARTLEAYAREGASWRVLGAWSDDAEVRAPPFDALSLHLSRLWL